MIRVNHFDVAPVDPPFVYGTTMRGDIPERPRFTANLALDLDAEGLAVFLAAMDEACPGFRSRYTRAASLPALPPEPLEAEFDDDDAPPVPRLAQRGRR
jgi:hypothetical protein